MRRRIGLGFLAGITLILGTVTAMYGADIDDPYLWLEDIHGAKPLEWVNEQNAVALKRSRTP